MAETSLVQYLLCFEGIYIYASLIVHCAELCIPQINGENNWEPV